MIARDIFLVAAGGAAGSVMRWWMGDLVQRASGTTFPWGTFAVNVMGSLAIGLLGAWLLGRAAVAPELRLFLMIGVLGGFTTFSTFSFETFALLRANQWPLAMAYSAGSVLAGLAATFLGYALVARSGP